MGCQDHRPKRLSGNQRREHQLTYGWDQRRGSNGRERAGRQSSPHCSPSHRPSRLPGRFCPGQTYWAVFWRARDPCSKQRSNWSARPSRHSEAAHERMQRTQSRLPQCGRMLSVIHGGKRVYYSAFLALIIIRQCVIKDEFLLWLSNYHKPGMWYPCWWSVQQIGT